MGTFVQSQAGLCETNGATSSMECAYDAELDQLLLLLLYLLLFVVIIEWRRVKNIVIIAGRRTSSGCGALRCCLQCPKSAVKECRVWKLLLERLMGCFLISFKMVLQCWECSSGLCALLGEKGGRNPRCCRNKRKGKQKVRWRASLNHVLHTEDENSIACCYLLWPHKIQSTWEFKWL